MSANWTQAWVTPGLSFFLERVNSSIQIGGLVLTDNNGALAANGIDVASTWSLYPAKNDEIFMNKVPGDRIRVVAGDLYFNNELIATQGNISNVSDWSFYPALHAVEMIQEDIVWEDPADPLITYTLNGSTGQLVFKGSNLDPSTWSRYPALQDVNFANYNLNNGNQLNCKKVFGNGTSNTYSNILELLADGNIYVKPGTLTNVLTESVCLIQTQGGIGGHVIIEGNPGGNGFLNPGIVDVIANPSLSPDGNIGRGGTVNIVANSVIGLEPALTQTSKVVLSGASVLSYAGYVAPVLSTAGYNYIWGGVGVDIQCDVVPPIVPSFAGTIYMLGRLGVAIGTASTLGTDYGLFASLIQPYSDGVSRANLVIKGKFTAKVELRDISVFEGSSCALNGITTINGSPYVSGSSWYLYPALLNVNMNNNSISNVSNIATSNINGVPYVSGSAWSSYPATQNVNLNNFAISNCSNITTSNVTTTTVNAVTYIPTTQWATQPAVQNVSMSGFSISGVNQISPNTAVLSLFASNVNVFGNVTVGTLVPTLSNELTTKYYVDSLASSDWSSFPALSNVNMNGFSISNLVNINGFAYVRTSQWSTLPAVSTTNFANQDLINVSTVFFGPLDSATPYLEATGGGVIGITTATPFINQSYYLTGVLTPTQSNELCSKQYVDSLTSSDWAAYPAISNVNMSNRTISNVNNIVTTNINGSAYVPSSSWSTFAAISNVNIAGYEVSNVARVQWGTGVGAPYISFIGTTLISASPFINSSYFTTNVLVPTRVNELTTKQYVDSFVTSCNGNSTIVNAALSTVNQIVGSIAGVVVSANRKVVVNATFTIQTNTNTKHDVTYFVMFNGVQLGSQMIHTIDGTGHYATLAITGYSGVLAAGTYTAELFARADVNTTITVTALNINATANFS